MNPYEPTIHQNEATPTRGNRSVWLLLLALALGITCIVVALMILVETLGIADRNGSWNAELTKGATAATVIGLLGFGWMISSRLYWVRRRSLANTISLATLGSAVLFVVLAARGIIL